MIMGIDVSTAWVDNLALVSSLTRPHKKA